MRGALAELALWRARRNTRRFEEVTDLEAKRRYHARSRFWRDVAICIDGSFPGSDDVTEVTAADADFAGRDNPNGALR